MGNMIQLLRDFILRLPDRLVLELTAGIQWVLFPPLYDHIKCFTIPASAVATVRQTLLHLPSSVQMWMNNNLITFVITKITYCTVSFLHPQQPHKTIIFDRELTANNYRNILDI